MSSGSPDKVEWRGAKTWGGGEEWRGEEKKWRIREEEEAL